MPASLDVAQPDSLKPDRRQPVLRLQSSFAGLVTEAKKKPLPLMRYASERAPRSKDLQTSRGTTLMTSKIPAIGLAMLVALCLTHQASALSIRRTPIQTAVSNCQPAQPSFEGAFRKRPLGIGNEGGSVAFLSCAIATDRLRSSGVEVVAVMVSNRGPAASDVTCTLVDGFGPQEQAPFTTRLLPKSVSIPPGQQAELLWTTAQFGGQTFSLPNLSCAMPAGFELNDTQTVFSIDVGIL